MATVFCYDSFFLFTQDSNNIQILIGCWLPAITVAPLFLILMNFYWQITDYPTITFSKFISLFLSLQCKIKLFSTMPP
jgi:hypothetical protein